MILGIETSTRIGSVALVESQCCIDEMVIDDQLSHSRNFITALDTLLSRSGIDMSSLTGIAVDRGPGSFTGIRVGLSVAKGLVFGTHKSLIGIDAFDAMMFDYRPAPARCTIIPVIDAKRGEIYAARYRYAAGTMERVQEPLLASLATVVRDIEQETLLIGPDVTLLKEAMCLGEHIPRLTVSEAVVCPSARNVALMGERLFCAGQGTRTVTPLYLSLFKPKGG